jgi:hypothetical protein
MNADGSLRFHTEVPVCYDTLLGNNQTLLEQARTILANSWEQAADVVFPGWGPCNYDAMVYPGVVAITFAGGTNGSTSPLGMTFTAALNKEIDQNKCGVLASRRVCYKPGVTGVQLISNDPDPVKQKFRYEVIHEFGHALAFAHEQERPDNWTAAGAPINCGQTDMGRKARTGGTYESPYDAASIMNYCATDPLVGGLPTRLSANDIAGVRKVYARNGSAHGFLIQSDTNSRLAVNAFGGAAAGTVIKLHDACSVANPDCTWSYQYGMLVSDTDPTLAINAVGGAAEGTVLKLSAACTPANPDCTWTYKNGQFLSDRNPALAINAANGARLGATLVVTAACTPSNPDCTWTMPNVMLSNARNTALAVNAFNGAGNEVALKLHDACTAANPDCTWTFRKGMLVSDTNASLAVNAFNGAADGTVIRLSNLCTQINKDCTWTWRQGELISDNSGATPLPINAAGGALFLAPLQLAAACTAANADCVFSGLFARN